MREREKEHTNKEHQVTMNYTIHASNKMLFSVHGLRYVEARHRIKFVKGHVAFNFIDPYSVDIDDKLNWPVKINVKDTHTHDREYTV